MTETQPAGGYVFVPREPTEEMLNAARGLIMARDLGSPSETHSLGDVGRSGFYGRDWAHILTAAEVAMSSPLTKAHFAQLIYRAMLSAAPPPQEPEGGALREVIARLAEVEGDLNDRAEACLSIVATAGDDPSKARIAGKAQAYFHAAQLVHAALKTEEN